MAEKQGARVPPNMATPIPPFVHQSLAMGLPVVGKKDDIDDMSEAMTRDILKVSRLKMVRDTLNPPVQQQQLQQPIDYSGVFKAMGDMNNNLATQLTGMIAANNQNAQSPVIMELKHQIEKVSEKLDSRNQGNQQSEMETLFNGMARLDAMGGILRKSLGIPDSVKTSTGDLPQMLQMEQLRLSEGRAQREHEERMKMLDRQFVVDDRNSTRQFNLDVMKFADERKRKDHTSAMFEDIVASVMDGIDLSPDEKHMLGIGGQPGSSQSDNGPSAPGPELQPRIMSFKCQSCGGRVPVPGPEVKQLSCPGCQAEYSIDSSDSPPSPPPLASPPVSGKVAA